MAKLNVLGCDHCRSVTFAVGTLSLHNGRGKGGIVSLDLCQKHMQRIKAIFKPGPLDTKSPRKRYGTVVKECMAGLLAYAQEHPEPFGLRAVMQALKLPEKTYSSLGRASEELLKQGALTRVSFKTYAAAKKVRNTHGRISNRKPRREMTTVAAETAGT